jgi:O-antigen ligase
MAAAAQSSLGRSESAASYLWILAAAGLMAFGAASGVAIAFGEANAFYITLSVILGAAILVDFRVGAVLLILLLPLVATFFLPHSMFGIPSLNPFNIVLAATLASYLMRGKVGRFAPRPLVWLYLVPILIAGAIGWPHVNDIRQYFFDLGGLQFTDEWGYYREMTVRPLLIVVVALLIGAAITRAQKPEGFIVAIAVSTVIMALIELAFIAASGVRLGSLASTSARAFFDDVGLHANDLGRLFAVSYALLVFVWWDTQKPGLKTGLFLTLCLTGIAMILSFSRGGMLGFAIATGMFLLWKFNARSFGLVICAAIIALIVAPEPVWNRITLGFASGDVNTVSAGRIEGIWAPLLPELGTSPIWGSGIGSIMYSYPMLNDMMSLVGHPHNAYLEAALDMGFVGLALLLAYFVHVWRGFRALGSNAYLSPEMRAFFQGAAAALMVFLITGWTGSSLRPRSEFGFLWVAIGMMYGMLARKPEKPAASTPAS